MRISGYVLCSYVPIVRRILISLILSLGMVACASKHEVAEDYRNAIGAGSPPSKTGRTVILFLVDGLSVPTLSQELAGGHLPNLQKFFLAGKNQFFKARTIFPSLTFPAITSLLTESPVDKNGIYGNVIFKDGKKTNFDVINGYPALNSMIQGQNIFSRLGAKGLRTVSFDYAFKSGTTAHTELNDLKAGLAVAGEDYAYVDLKTLDSLQVLLRKTAPQSWPDFIFVHLIGVDLTSHDAGPKSEQVAAYLEQLDSKLGATFAILNKTETSHKREVLSILTADHGFDLPVTKSIALEEALGKMDGEIRILNEGRYLGLYFPANWTPTKRSALLANLARMPDVDITALATDTKIEIQSQTVRTDLFAEKASACAGGISLAVQPVAEGPMLASAAPAFQCEQQLDEHTN
ncbi:MAG: alkaline phosphatase family protein, partial [Bdellovibrionales bacterium]